jgi:hypothetical protein
MELLGVFVGKKRSVRLVSKNGNSRASVLTVEGEDLVNDVVLDVPEAPARRRLVGVGQHAAAERRVELDVLADQLRPEPLHLLVPCSGGRDAALFLQGVDTEKAQPGGHAIGVLRWRCLRHGHRGCLLRWHSALRRKR